MTSTVIRFSGHRHPSIRHGEPPVVTLVCPLSGSLAAVDDAVTIDVTDDAGLGRVRLVALFESVGVEELVHDGYDRFGVEELVHAGYDRFASAYSDSSRVAVHGATWRRVDSSTDADGSTGPSSGP